MEKGGFAMLLLYICNLVDQNKAKIKCINRSTLLELVSTIDILGTVSDLGR